VQIDSCRFVVICTASDSVCVIASRVMSSVSRKVEVCIVICDITGTKKPFHSALVRCTGYAFKEFLLYLYAVCESFVLLFQNVSPNYQLKTGTIQLTITYLFAYLFTYSGHSVLYLRLAILGRICAIDLLA